MTSRIRRCGDKGTGGQGDKETRGQGDFVSLSLPPPFPLSPCPLVSLRQSRIINPINVGKMKTAEAIGVTLLDAPENPIAAFCQSAPAQTGIRLALRTPRHSACFLEATAPMTPQIPIHSAKVPTPARLNI